MICIYTCGNPHSYMLNAGAKMSFSRNCFVLYVLLSALLNVVHLQDDSDEFKPRYLTKDEFDRLMESDNRFLVNFVSPGCVKCSEFAPEYEEVADYFGTTKADMDIGVMIEGDLQVIRKQGLRRLPSLYYVREKTPILYTGDMNANSVIQWVEITGRKIHRTLTDDDFEHLTQAATGATTGDWLILFCDVENSDCSILLPMWESIAYRLHSLVNVAVLDVANNPKTTGRFKLSSSPTIQLFRRGKRYVYNLQLRDDATIITFAQNGHKRFTPIDIVPEQTPFDTLTENIADQLKEVLPESQSSKLVVIGIPVVIILLIIIIVLRRSGGTPPPERTKKGV